MNPIEEQAYQAAIIQSQPSVPEDVEEKNTGQRDNGAAPTLPGRQVKATRNSKDLEMHQEPQANQATGKGGPDEPDEDCAVDVNEAQVMDWKKEGNGMFGSTDDQKDSAMQPPLSIMIAKSSADKGKQSVEILGQARAQEASENVRSSQPRKRGRRAKSSRRNNKSTEEEKDAPYEELMGNVEDDNQGSSNQQNELMQIPLNIKTSSPGHALIDSSDQQLGVIELTSGHKNGNIGKKRTRNELAGSGEGGSGNQ